MSQLTGKQIVKMSHELDIYRDVLSKIANHKIDEWEEYTDGYFDLKRIAGDALNRGKKVKHGNTR